MKAWLLKFLKKMGKHYTFLEEAIKLEVQATFSKVGKMMRLKVVFNILKHSKG